MSNVPTIFDFASQLVRLKKIGGEFKGPCPFCGGTDRFSIFKDGGGWLCRKCTPKSAGVFDFIAKLENISLEDAMKRYRDPKGPPRPQMNGARRPKLAEPIKTIEGDFLTEDWQARANSLVETCEKNLTGSEDAKNYLISRAIDFETARAFRLGYEPRTDALVIPWIGKDGRVVAVKYRKIGKDVDKKSRFQQLKGGRQILFGGHLCKSLSACIVVEGELNAISLYQAIGNEFDVFSLGGEVNMSSIDVICRLYKHGLVWLDSTDKLDKLQEGHSLLSWRFCCSPDGKDANEIAQLYGDDVLAGLARAAAQGVKAA